jgi:orotate phosphoribosyltransferase
MESFTLSILEIQAVCAKRGAILTNDHVVLTPKADGHYHAPGYFDKDRVLSNAQVLESIASHFAAAFLSEGIEVVAGPTVGAVSLAAVTAIKLNARSAQKLDWVYAEESVEQSLGAKKRVIKRCFPAYVKNKRVLVVEDVFSSGGSAKQTIEAVQAVGGQVVGVAVICNRSGLQADDLAVPRLVVLFDIPMVMHREEDCPLCAAKVPINMQVGHGLEFFKRFPESPVPKKPVSV